MGYTHTSLRSTTVSISRRSATGLKSCRSSTACPNSRHPWLRARLIRTRKSILQKKKKLIADYLCHSEKVAASHYKVGFQKTSVDALAVLEEIEADQAAEGKGNRESETVDAAVAHSIPQAVANTLVDERLPLIMRYHRLRLRVRHRTPMFCQRHRKRRSTLRWTEFWMS
ncbi:hypothetical protein DPMN_045216 [Dreissena polymorpha]|uniref:Uncharacterized protein n=1 Tax=Dreissena polymorpha TaxID=45954 RepID=A0A9D4HZI4_DREPO|nr:hypothetical protein DPMN_045216 [Dreissena polymorpha]